MCRVSWVSRATTRYLRTSLRTAASTGFRRHTSSGWRDRRTALSRCTTRRTSAEKGGYRDHSCPADLRETTITGRDCRRRMDWEALLGWSPNRWRERCWWQYTSTATSSGSILPFIWQEWPVSISILALCCLFLSMQKLSFADFRRFRDRRFSKFSSRLLTKLKVLYFAFVLVVIFV